MSTNALHWAFEQRLANPFQQIVLYVVAEWADPRGVARQCDLTEIAECSRLSPTRVRKHLAELRSIGTIEAAETATEGGAKLFDISLRLDRAIEVKREPVPDIKRPNAPAQPASATYPADSTEAKAIKTLHLIAGRSSAFFKIFRRADGSVTFLKEMTPQLQALGRAEDPASWPVLEHRHAGAWEQMLNAFFDPAVIRAHLRAGSRAPWPWPPGKDGKLYTSATGPPETLMSEQDMADFH